MSERLDQPGLKEVNPPSGSNWEKDRAALVQILQANLNSGAFTGAMSEVESFVKTHYNRKLKENVANNGSWEGDKRGLIEALSDQLRRDDFESAQSQISQFLRQNYALILKDTDLKAEIASQKKMSMPRKLGWEEDTSYSGLFPDRPGLIREWQDFTAAVKELAQAQTDDPNLKLLWDKVNGYIARSPLPLKEMAGILNVLCERYRYAQLNLYRIPDLAKQLRDRFPLPPLAEPKEASTPEPKPDIRQIIKKMNERRRRKKTAKTNQRSRPQQLVEIDKSNFNQFIEDLQNRDPALSDGKIADFLEISSIRLNSLLDADIPLCTATEKMLQRLIKLAEKVYRGKKIPQQKSGSFPIDVNQLRQLVDYIKNTESGFTNKDIALMCGLGVERFNNLLQGNQRYMTPEEVGNLWKFAQRMEKKEIIGTQRVSRFRGEKVVMDSNNFSQLVEYIQTIDPSLSLQEIASYVELKKSALQMFLERSILYPEKGVKKIATALFDLIEEVKDGSFRKERRQAERGEIKGMRKNRLQAIKAEDEIKIDKDQLRQLVDFILSTNPMVKTQRDISRLINLSNFDQLSFLLSKKIEAEIMKKKDIEALFALAEEGIGNRSNRMITIDSSQLRQILDYIYKNHPEKPTRSNIAQYIKIPTDRLYKLSYNKTQYGSGPRRMAESEIEALFNLVKGSQLGSIHRSKPSTIPKDVVIDKENLRQYIDFIQSIAPALKIPAIEKYIGLYRGALYKLMADKYNRKGLSEGQVWKLLELKEPANCQLALAPGKSTKDDAEKNHKDLLPKTKANLQPINKKESIPQKKHILLDKANFYQFMAFIKEIDPVLKISDIARLSGIKQLRLYRWLDQKNETQTIKSEEVMALFTIPDQIASKGEDAKIIVDKNNIRQLVDYILEKQPNVKKSEIARLIDIDIDIFFQLLNDKNFIKTMTKGQANQLYNLAQKSDISELSIGPKVLLDKYNFRQLIDYLKMATGMTERKIAQRVSIPDGRFYNLLASDLSGKSSIIKNITREEVEKIFEFVHKVERDEVERG